MTVLSTIRKDWRRQDLIRDCMVWVAFHLIVDYYADEAHELVASTKVVCCFDWSRYPRMRNSVCSLLAAFEPSSWYAEHSSNVDESQVAPSTSLHSSLLGNLDVLAWCIPSSCTPSALFARRCFRSDQTHSRLPTKYPQ